jgi:hypothetical protein
MRHLITVMVMLLIPVSAWGWDFSKHSIPVEQIMSGGPPRDGIPALTNPK